MQRPTPIHVISYAAAFAMVGVCTALALGGGSWSPRCSSFGRSSPRRPAQSSSLRALWGLGPCRHGAGEAGRPSQQATESVQLQGRSTDRAPIVVTVMSLKLLLPLLLPSTVIPALVIAK